MKKRSMKKGFLPLLLVLTMLVSMMVVPASADEGTGSALDNLVMNKTVQLEDDGTYTINLEAYAKGQVSTETVKRVVPADIILVLDQSGSMAQQNISGIPSNEYTEVSGLTNGQVASGTYYYKVGDNYYPVTATQETVGVETTWVGQDGKTYTEDELSYSWSRKSDGQVYNTATPFVTSSLKTYTRTLGGLSGRVVYYVNDNNPDDTTQAAFIYSAAEAREKFLELKKTDTNTVEFHNDGGNFGNWEQDNPYYVAAVYTAVTRQEVRTYQYTYSYIDENGRQVIIGTSQGGETDPCTVTPLYTRGTTDGTRLQALQYAADRFIDSIRSSAIANGVDHRVAVVGFGSDDYSNSSNEYYYANTELFIGSTQYNYHVNGKESTYNTNGNLASNHYSDAFQSVNTAEGYNNLMASVNALAGKGATYPNLGFEMANGIFKANTTQDGETRSRIVIFLTDGEPGDSGYDSSAASSALTQVGITKNTYGATVYTVAVLDAAATGNVDTFLKSTSSDGTYTLATSTGALDDFFQTIDENINSTTTTVTLSENSIMVDRLSNYFEVPADFSVENNVTVQVAQHTGYESFANPIAAPERVTAVTSTAADGTIRGVEVRGFNFVSDENLVTTSVSSGGSTIATGNKLVVTITGVLAKDEAATNTYIDTNLSLSGIWDTDESGAYGMVKAFNMPTTYVEDKTYVLDYAKEVSLDIFDSSARRLDSAEDGVFSKVDENATSLPGSYGVSNVKDSGLTYTPTTTNWNGFDTFYALGKDAASAHTSDNMWVKVNVIPANNVYYEDTFVTDTEGTVGIKYSGSWSTDDTAANAGEVDGSADVADVTDGNHGWIESKDDDTTYSDGSAHEGQTGATATFTFTGTGVDVYSRTNETTGVVVARLYKGTDTTVAAYVKSLTIDNLAQSGDYYQIPTLHFEGLEHGTYTVKLTVTAAAKGRTTYYLDGIRVYNPLSAEQEADQTVQEAYGDEIGATFLTVRDMLVDATTDVEAFNNGGTVFIDYNPAVSNEDNSAVLGTYVDYGPKNEVYLAKDQAVYIKVGEGASKIAVGLKAPEGATAAAQITNGEATSTIDINGASDQYYTITPDANGNIIIKNTGDNLLSVTKIKMSGDVVAEGMSSFTIDEPMMMSYANTFSSLPEVAYIESEEVQEPAADDTTEAPEQGDVVIENPEDSASDDVASDDSSVSVSDGWISRLVSSIRRLLGF